MHDDVVRVRAQADKVRLELALLQRLLDANAADAVHENRADAVVLDAVARLRRRVIVSASGEAEGATRDIRFREREVLALATQARPLVVDEQLDAPVRWRR